MRRQEFYENTKADVKTPEGVPTNDGMPVIQKDFVGQKQTNHVPNRAQWHQLPMLMTPEEMGNTTSGDFAPRPMSVAANFLHHNMGHREDRDASMVEGIRHSIRKEGYDERFPVQIMHGGRINDGKPYVREGHHRATAGMDEGVLIPVVHHTDSRHFSEERIRQRNLAWTPK